ncbi:MAG: hypothetical protein ACPLRW_07085 [Moorellales bacterium]
MPHPPCDSELKAKALAIAQELGAAEAARATGIPAGTIRSWLHRMQRNGNGGGRCNNVATQRETQKFKALKEEAFSRAIEEAGGYIIERLKGLADGLYAAAEEALREFRTFMARPGEKDRDAAAWLRAVVGAMHYAIQDAQLLSGKPTARPEVVERREYDITQRIIADPEALDLAEALLRRAANSNAGPLCLYGERGSVDPV